MPDGKGLRCQVADALKSSTRDRYAEIRSTNSDDADGIDGGKTILDQCQKEYEFTGPPQPTEDIAEL